MQSKFKDAINYFKFGDLENSKKICEEILLLEKKNINFLNFYAYVLYSNKEFNLAINIWEEAINLDSHHKESLNGIGSAFKKVKKYERAIEYFKKALKVDSNFFDAYYNLANVYLELTNYEQSIIYFKQAYKLKPNFIKIIYGIGYSLMKDLDYEGALRYFFQYLEKDDKNSEIFNFIGICLNKLRRYEESINYYCKSLELDSKNAHSVDNLLNLFTYYEPKKKYKNFIVKINSEVKELNKNFDLNKKINEKEILELFEKIIPMSSSNHMLNELNLDQVYKRNKINLNCERHFKVFNSFNTIPEFCFGCYKIQISPKNIIELIKLYIIFDQFKFGKDIFRKTLIEVRPKVSGTYKGLIYCSSKEESKEILDKIIPILKINLGNDVAFEVKRGCSEFAISYPGFEKLDSNIKFNPKWNENEKIIDNKEKKKEMAILENSIMGLNIYDAIFL